MHLAVIGTGYVGLIAGAGFADMGNDVVCADVEAAKIARLMAGEVPIYEPGLDALLARTTKTGRLTFSADVAAAVAGAELVFIAVGTPQGEAGAAELSAVLAVARTIAQSITGFTIVVTKSTVPVGTADRLKQLMSELCTHPFAVVSNPEFLKEGDAINDFMRPDRVIVGTDDARAREAMRHLYAPFLRTSDRLHFMTARSAELTKYAANAYLATRISLMNELANLSEKVGADIDQVRKALGADPRIGPRFLFPGVGFGGSCFPKDLKALLHAGQLADVPLDVVAAVQRVNDRQKRVMAGKLGRHYKSVAGKTIAIWGLSFKPGTDDIREAPALALIDWLLSAGARVRAYDPAAMANVRELLGERLELAGDMYQALEGADGLCLMTEWHDFRGPDFPRMKRVMHTPVLFDGRNIWDPEQLAELGFSYYAIGRP